MAEQSSKEPFVSQADRPEVRINPDTPLSEKLEKPEIKEFKGEKNEKFEKHEKFEKPEIKEVKNEKLEQEPAFDPRRLPQPDPRIDRLIEAMSTLVTQVTLLTNQMEELRKRGGN